MKPRNPFELGTHIVYTQLAAVARKREKIWSVLEGWPKNARLDPQMLDKLSEFDPGKKINKAIFVWDEEGSGTVIGLVRRETGISYQGSYHGSYYGEEEYDPGWFDKISEDWFYAVRSRLDGIDYYLVPVGSAELPKEGRGLRNH